MAPRNTRPADTGPDQITDVQPELPGLGTFGGELGAMLAQARRPQRWFISNPTDDSVVPEGAYVAHGYPVEIAGTVVAIEKAATKFGPMPVYVLDVGKGPDFPLIRFGLTATLLRNAHERHNVAPGDVVAASCPGKRQGKDQEYEDWAMIVQKGDGTVPTAGVGASIVS
jgi:hypothetical protein